MKSRILLLASVFLFGISCSNSDSTEEPQPMETSAKYSVTVTGNWSEANHPNNFPDNDHFSPVAGMVHNNGASLFTTGNLASPGIKKMAETGGTNPLDDEVESFINSGDALSFVKDAGLPTGTSEIEFEIDLTKDHPLVSLVSMIAPSPDWFVAVSNVNLYENGLFLDQITVEAGTYDAGTDSGENFTSANQPSDPVENVFAIKEAPLGNGTSVEIHLMSFQFKKISSQ